MFETSVLISAYVLSEKIKAGIFFARSFASVVFANPILIRESFFTLWIWFKLRFISDDYKTQLLELLLKENSEQTKQSPQ